MRGAIKPADAPKAIEDLLNPKYKGKFVMPDPTQHTTTLQWIASLYKIMGKEKAEKFTRDLGATKPLLVESLAPAAERVSTAETPLGQQGWRRAKLRPRQDAQPGAIHRAQQQGVTTQQRQGVHRFFSRR